MNAHQRRTTYRRLRKLMREKTPVRFRLQAGVPGEFVTGRVEIAYRQQGMALVRDLQHHFKPQYHAAQYIRPLPRCWRA